MRALLSVILLSATINCFAQTNDCLANSKEYFAEKNYPAAYSILKKCLAKNPKNADILTSLGGLEMMLGNFNSARSAFRAALTVLNTKSPYQSYINSRLGDIAMHNANLQEASYYYDNALRYEPANINALVGRAICEERSGNKTEAAMLFKKALAVDFTNIVARERLVAMEPSILKDDELLIALRERNIIDPIATTFDEEDRELFNQIHRAEENNGIEYLSIKYENKIPSGFIVERDGGKLYVRKMLTLTGYKELIAQLSKEAKQLFLSKGIDPGTVFELKDFDDEKLFDNQGNLTENGLNAYTKALRGAKSWLLPTESVPQTPTQVDALAQKYIAQGYSEITMHEFLYTMRVTRCTEQTLTKDLRARVINIDSHRKRVFLISGPKAVEPFNLPYNYILEYRQKNAAKKDKKQDVYTSTFGTGSRETVKLCKKDGTLLGNF